MERRSPAFLALASAAMLATAAAVPQASRDNVAPPGIELVGGRYDQGVPWHGGRKSRTSLGAGKPQRKNRGRSQMARKSQRRARKKHLR